MPARGAKTTKMQWLLLRLAEKGFRYWMTAVVILAVTLFASSALYDAFDLQDKRARLFQRLLDWGPRPAEPKFVKLVLIGDDEYWLGRLAGRAPIKRDYLASLVDKMVEANAHVIALDFDARLPDPNSMQIPAEYKDESCTLIKSIKNAAKKGKKLVLATPIAFNAGYRQEPDIYQANGLCLPADKSSNQPCGVAFEPAETANVSCGYIALPDDQLTIPLQLPLIDGRKLDSFALAVARSKQPELVDNLLKRIGNRVSYANYIPEPEFRKFNAWLSAKDVLQASGEANQRTLQGSAVIVGANWRIYAAGRGPLIDLQDTPIGRIVGALLLANFAEALLDTRVFSAMPKYLVVGSEILFGLVAAVMLALFRSFAVQLAALFGFVLVAFGIQVLALYLVGVFFDVFLPLLGLAVHALGDRLIISFESKHPGRRTQSN